MTEGEKTRLIAWSNEMRSVHARLREALEIAYDALDDGGRDPLLFCHGFCVALDGHHRGEDRELFPAIAAEHPELRDVLRQLQQDHSMIGHLLGGLQNAVASAAGPTELEQHLDGIGAVMETHFRYEERKLLGVLETLGLDADPRVVFGDL